MFKYTKIIEQPICVINIFKYLFKLYNLFVHFCFVRNTNLKIKLELCTIEIISYNINFHVILSNTVKSFFTSQLLKPLQI